MGRRKQLLFLLFMVGVVVGLSAQAGLGGVWWHGAYEVGLDLRWSSQITGTGLLNGDFAYEEVISNDVGDSGTAPLATVFHEQGGVTINVAGGEEIWNLYRNLTENVMVGIGSEEDYGALKTFVQPATNHGAADLGGTWHVRRLLFVPGVMPLVGYGTAEGSLKGTMTSRWEYSRVETAEKLLTVSSSITANGVVSLKVRVPKTDAGGELDDFNYTGYMNASRDVIISTSAANAAEANWNLLVLVKQGSAYSEADVGGTWAMAQMSLGPDGMLDVGAVADAVAFTQGFGALNGRFNVADTEPGFLGPPVTDRYIVDLQTTIAADGHVVIAPRDGMMPMTGMMNASKDVIVCADNHGGDVNYSLLVKVSDDAPGGLVFTTANGKATVSAFDGSGVAVVPETYNGLPVTGIAPRAFADNIWLNNVVLPKTLQSIGDDAFRGCVSLEWLAMPENLSSIGAGAFNGCDELVGVFFLGGRPNVGGALGSSATLYHAQGRAAWDGGDVLGGLPVELVLYASKDSFTYGDVPLGVQITGYQGSSVPIVNVPGSLGGKAVVAIGGHAFSNQSDMVFIVFPEGLYELGDSASASCSNLLAAFLPESLTSIGEWAFEECESLIFCDLPENLTEIGTEAFIDCEALASMVFPNGLETIGDWAFSNCASLQEIALPSALRSLGVEVFGGCRNVQRYSVAANNEFFAHTADGVLCNKALSRLIQYPAGRPGPYVIPASITEIGTSAFHSATLASIVIPAHVTTIGDYAFGACDLLLAIEVAATNPYYAHTDDGVLISKDGKNLLQYPGGLAGSWTVPDSVERIANGAFAGCWRLTGIQFGAQVRTIGSWAFASCYGLKDVHLPQGLQALSEGLFEDCRSLRTVIIPDTVTAIGDSAFENCTRLENVIIPASVTSIGDEAFDECEKLRSIVLPDSVVALGREVFGDCVSLEMVILGRGITVLPEQLFYGCSALSDIGIMGAVTEIGPMAFNNCNSLVAFAVPATVVSIGDYAFQGCPLLEEITFNGPPPAIGQMPFPDQWDVVLSYWLSQPGWNTLGPSWDNYLDQLESMVRTFTVRFVTGGAGVRTGGAELVQAVEENQQADLPVITPVGAGWTFVGWDPSPAIPITADQEFRAQYRFEYDLSAGWNLISPTLLPLPQFAQQIVEWGLIGFDPQGKNYAKSDGVEVGKAYWVFIAEDKVATIGGFGPENDGLSVPLRSGWHFVGPALPMAVQPDVEAAWEWAGANYRLADVLEPGHGYWLYQP